MGTYPAEQVLHAIQWLYQVWEGTFLDARFMDTELRDLSLPCDMEDFRLVQV